MRRSDAQGHLAIQRKVRTCFLLLVSWLRNRSSPKSKQLSNAAAHVMLIIFAHCAFCAKFIVGVKITVCWRVQFLYNIELSYRYKHNYQSHFDLKTAKDHTYILFTTTLHTQKVWVIISSKYLNCQWCLFFSSHFRLT